MNLQEQIKRVLREEVGSVDMKTIQSELTNILGPSKIKNGNRVEYKYKFGSFDSRFNIVVDRLDQRTLVFINDFMSKKGWFPTSIGLPDMKQHIYSKSFQNYIGKDDVEIGYESNTGKEINLKQSKVYHVSPDTFVNNIIENGIVLKSESKLGDHPERIYLYLNKDNSKDMVTTIWGSLSQERKETIKDYYVLEIDLSQIPNHKFYHDPASMVTLGAIYTNQSIPKSAVKVIDKINTNDLKTYDEDKVMTPEQEKEEREERKRREEERIRKEKEDSIRDAEYKKNYEQIPDDIKNMSIDDLFESKNLHENIKKVLREEVNKKYPKPSENLIKSVYNWLNLYFDNSKIYEDGDSVDRGFYFEFCKNGRSISYLRIRLDDRSPDWGPRDRRPSSERSVDEVSLYIYPIMVDMMQKVFPMRKNYIMYLIEEWFEDTYLYKIQQMVNRNDLSLDYIAEFSNKKGELCVPPITKPEDTETQEMMDFIKKNTFFSYNQMEEYEEEEPGWIERMYLGIIRNKERERINREDRENNPDPIDYDGY